MNLNFRPFHSGDLPQLTDMMIRLYLEDSEGKKMTTEKIDLTIQRLSEQPESGSLIIIEKGGFVTGYALLIYYWSNEYGGVITHLDEIFILPEYRSSGVASAFIRQLLAGVFKKSVAYQLQVMPSNKRALQLYKRLGFEADKNSYLIYEPKERR